MLIKVQEIEEFFADFFVSLPLGSATLHHWQQLAQPHLGVILDPTPGVVSKGYRPLELELEQVCVFPAILPGYI